ncbi:MAG: AI-2E family transporter [Pirellulaceae bacterium]
MPNIQETTHARTQTVCLMVLAVVAGTYAIYWLRPVLVPLVVALFVVSGVSPILKTLEKRLGVSRLIAAGLTFMAGVVLLIVFGLSIWVSLVDLKNNSQAYRQRVGEIVNWGEQRVREFGHSAEQSISSILPNATDAEADEDKVAIEEVTEPEAATDTMVAETHRVPETATRKGQTNASDFVDAMVRDGVGVVSQALVNLVSTSVIVLIYVFFLLIGSPSGGHQSPVVREIDLQIRSYLSLKTVISIFTGLVFGAALHLFGVPMAFTFGVLAFLLNFVPNIGPVVASLLPVPLIILNPDAGIVWMVAAITVTCAIQGISGNLVEPKVMGNSSDLHPVTILVALMFWGMIWGVIGMFLATPITAVIKILLQRIESTRPLANIMAGRWTHEKTVEDGG